MYLLLPCWHLLLTTARLQSDFKVVEFEPKTFEETDVEIAITHCGYVRLLP
jgi:hypothetical protein